MAAAPALSTQQPNPPTFPSSVQIFSPVDEPAEIAAAVHNATAPLLERHTGHFSTARVALLFKPGTYVTDVHVGYYTGERVCTGARARTWHINR